MKELQIFNYEGNNVRTVLREGEPWWVLKDVCAILGIENSKHVKMRLEDDEVGSFDLPHPQNPSKMLGMLCVNEPGLYNVIIRSDKPESRKFKRWVTHEVLPSIRKHGAYMTAKTMEELLSDPDTLIDLIKTLKHEREKSKALIEENEKQSHIIGELKPKADYVDLILSSKRAMTVSQIAADYSISANRLNKILKEERVQRNVGGQWILYKEHMNKGFTKSKTIHIERADGLPDTVMHTLWTQKGRLYINSLLNERGIYANADIADPDMEVSG